VTNALFATDHDPSERRTPAITLWPHQAEAAAAIGNNKRLLITLPVGRGKTFAGLAALAHPGSLPAVAFVHAGEEHEWVANATRMWPGLHTITNASPNPNPNTTETHRTADVLVLDYDQAWAWERELTGTVRTVILDVAVQHLNSQNTRTAWNINIVADHADYVVGLDQTVSRHADAFDLWILYRAIAPHVLGPFEEFLREWARPSENGPVIARPHDLGDRLTVAGVWFDRTVQDIHRAKVATPAEQKDERQAP